MVDIWENRKYLDLWSVNHVLYGLVFGYFLNSFEVSFELSFFLVFLIMIVHELIEYRSAIVQETWQNHFFDIVTTMGGFLLGFMVQVSRTTIIAAIIVLVILEVWGWKTVLSR